MIFQSARIVKFRNGLYGVRKRNLLGYWFMASNGKWYRRLNGAAFKLDFTESNAKLLLNFTTDLGEPE